MKIDQVSIKDKAPEEVELMIKAAAEKGYAVQIVYEMLKIYKKRKY